MDQDVTCHGGRPRPRPHCAVWGPSSPSPKTGRSPQFSSHICCGEMAGWIKMPLGREVGLSQSDIVLDGDPAPPHPKGAEPPISGPYLLWPNGWMDQDGTWYGGRPQPRLPSDVVLDGDLAPPIKGARPPVFGPCLLWQNGWMEEDSTLYGSKYQPRPLCVRWGPSSNTAVPLFSAHVYCGHGRPSQLLLSSCWHII